VLFYWQLNSFWSESNSICSFCTVGLPVSKEALDQVAEISGVMTENDDYLPIDVRERCELIIPEIADVNSKDAAETYLFLKAHYVTE
jgi:hypothetical protein